MKNYLYERLLNLKKVENEKGVVEFIYSTKLFMKKIIKVIILIIVLVLIVLLGMFVYNKYMKFKFKKMLTEHDSRNYELTEKFNGGETNVKVCGGVLISEDDSEIVWVDGVKGKRVILDKNSKIAVVTEKSDDLSVVSLNHTYIKNYFENIGVKFKYLGKEKDFYVLQFTTKKTGIVNLFYINQNTKLIEKVVEKDNNAETVTEFDIKLDSVSKSEVAYPDLSEYSIVNSSSNTDVNENQVYENKVEY